MGTEMEEVLKELTETFGESPIAMTVINIAKTAYAIGHTEGREQGHKEVLSAIGREQ